MNAKSQSGSVTLEFLAALLMALALISSACNPGNMLYPNYSETHGDEMRAYFAQQDAAAKLQQLPGVVSSLEQIALTAPVDDKTKEQISGYASWARVAAVTGSELGKVKSPEQLAGALTGLATLSQQLPVDSGTASQISNYVAWGSLIAKAAGIILPMVL